MMGWQDKNKKKYKDFIQEVKEKYPTLIVFQKDGLVYLKGTILIKDDEGNLLESFQVCIEIPPNFPKELPKLRETSNKIPKTIDRHFEADGYACLCFRDEIFLYWDLNSSIGDFLKIFVESFFIWQIEYEATGGKNAKEAMGHGVSGAIEFYQEILGTTDLKIIYNFVFLLSKKHIKGHLDTCYCGSKKLLKNCNHFEILQRYRDKIRTKDAKLTLQSLYQYINETDKQKKLLRDMNFLIV